MICHGIGCTNELAPNRAPGRPRKWCSDRCRKRTLYAQPCVDCGEPTDGSQGFQAEPRCLRCTNVRNGAARRVWTPDTVAHALRVWTDAHGRPPHPRDWNPATPGVHPSHQQVYRSFGTWAAGLAAAGISREPERVA
jgi:hypothetical protein